MRLPAIVIAALSPIPGLRALARRWRNPDLAAPERSLARGSELAVLQPWTTTGEDRYPALFDRLAELLAGTAAPRLLSYGCAGGQEVRALRRRLPDATIVGVDVNPRAIGRARRRDRSPNSRYLVGDRPPPGERFDAVLALAVFRHGSLGVERPERSTAILPFARAAAAFASLDAALRTGGMLAWGNAHFLLKDLPGGNHYVRIAEIADFEVMEVAYGAEDTRIPTGEERGGLYRKCG